MGEEWNEAHPGSVELRLILVGTIDCGKTLTADTLLGQKCSPLASALSSRSCQLRQGLSHSRRLTLVEAPRWYWSGGHLESSVQEETRHALSLAAPGPHAFLLLIPVSQFTEIERHIPQQIEAVFGLGALQYTLVLLTCGDYLLGRPAEQYLAKEDQGLREVIELCEGRYHVINNRQPENREQVIQLLKKVERMVQQNGGCYIEGVLLSGTQRPNLMDEVVVEKMHSVNTEFPWSPRGDGAKHKGLTEKTEMDEAEAERERLEKAKEERERMDKERLERERDEWVKKMQAEKGRQEKERAERERIIKERERKEKERFETQRRENEQLEKERIEKERLQRERAEREGIMKEREEKERKERLEMERRERERLERERIKKQILQREIAEKEKHEQERAEREKADALRREKEKAERERLEKEKEEEMERRNKQRIEKEKQEREEIERQEKERVERERIIKEREERLEKERRERERLERIKKERAQWGKAEAQRRVKERAERERKEQERMEKERREKERIEKERLDQEKLEREKEKERTAKKSLKREQMEKERLEKERVERARAEKERRERETTGRLEKARAEMEKRVKEGAEQEKQQKEKRATSTTANSLHSHIYPQKQELIEQQSVSHKTKGSSQSAADGVILSQFSKTIDDKTLKSIYYQIVTGEDSFLVPELRLVLLGYTRSGKSAAGNVILGRQEFESRANRAVTQQCEKGWAILGNRRVAVVDTPDWFCSERSPEEVRSQLSSCVALSSPGPHTFLLCVPVHQPPSPFLSPSSPTPLQALGALEAVFGPRMVSGHTMVLFTHSDCLEEGRGRGGGGRTAEVEKYITSKRPDLLKLVERCGDRYHILERAGHEYGGGDEEEERGKRSVEELLEKVKQMVKENGGDHYSCPLYQEVESCVKHRQEEILQARRERRMERRRREEGEGETKYAPPQCNLVSLKEDTKVEEEGMGEEDEEMELEKSREEAEKSVRLDSVPILSLPPAQSTSLLRFMGEKVGAGVKRVPKLLAGGALLGGGLGAFFGGLLGGAMGATGGAALAELARRKLSKHTDISGHSEEEKKNTQAPVTHVH